MSFRKACVTGGAGFIGSRLTRKLLDRGLSVVVLDNLSVGQRANVPDGAELIAGDILDPQAVESAIQGCDIVFHLAARVAIRSSFDFVVEDTMTNVAGTASVLRAAHRAGSVKKIIATSSMAVYSDTPRAEGISESHPTVPISPYGISKLASEGLTHSMAASSGMQSVVLRLFNTYGPGQHLSPYVGVVTIFVDKLARSGKPLVFGDGEQARDFVHVDDITSGFICAMDADISGKTFNIGTGRAWTVNRVLEAIANHMGVVAVPEHVPAVPGELRFSIADISQAEALLKYKPVHYFESSIGAVLDEILRRNGK